MVVDRLIPSAARAACSGESVRGAGDWVSGGDTEGVVGRAREEGAPGARVRPEATAGAWERLTPTDSPS
jgi:hypothetical protein